MPTVHTKDRRSSERVTFPSPLVLSLPEGSEPAVLRNLSVAGISCTTARRYAELTQIRITLDLPPAKAGEEPPLRLEVTGAVVRCRPLRHGTGRRRYEVALFFTDLGDHARVQLEKIVRSRLDAPQP
jgi:hypothetical protein